MQRDHDAAQAEMLLLALASGLHAAGQPSHRLEETLQQVAARLGVPLSVLAMPTAIIVSLDGPAGPRNHVLRPQSAGVNLERLGLLTRAADDAIDGAVSPQEARHQINAVLAMANRWKWPATVAAYVLSGGAFAVFFGGGWNEVVVATMVGLAVGALAVIMQRGRTATRMFELIAAAAAALVAGLADTLFGPVVGWVPLAAGLIILLPGISLVDAIEELAHGHLVSGGARLAGVGVVFLALTFGAVGGAVLAAGLTSADRTGHPEPLPGWAWGAALLVVAVGSTIRFRAHPRDVGVILIASALALSASRLGVAYIGTLAGPFLAALALGLGANLYARLQRTAAERFTIPGLAVLVPGSVGIRSLVALEAQDASAGVNAAFQMFLIAMALVAGLLFSNALARDAPAA